MTTVQISNVYNSVTFRGEVQEAQTELNTFVQAGVMVRDQALAGQLTEGGNTFELPNYAPLTFAEPNISNDVPGDTANPRNISSVTPKGRIIQHNQHWSTTDVAADLALQDPTAAITGRVAQYWTTDDQSLLINSLMGVLADNVANDSGDMVHSVYSDVVQGSLTAANYISGGAVLRAQQTMGDAKRAINSIAMHSIVYTQLQDQNLITTVQRTGPSGSEIQFDTYLNLRVIVDDAMPVVSGSNSDAYYVFLFGSGFVRYAPAPLSNATALTREELQGNGGGVEILTYRDNKAMHPMGFEWTDSSIAGQSATYAELATAANWNRLWDRKNIPFAALVVNASLA